MDSILEYLNLPTPKHWSLFLLGMGILVFNIVSYFSEKYKNTSNGDIITIDYAGYGVDDGKRVNVTEKVFASFRKGELPKKVTNQWLGDPYPNEKKNLIVIFSEHGKTKGAVKLVEEKGWLELP